MRAPVLSKGRLQHQFRCVDIKVLIQAFDRPWLIEPSAAQAWAEVLHGIITGSSEIESKWIDPDQAFRVNDSAQRSEDGSVLVLPINGPMMKNDFCGSPGTATMAANIMAANQDPSIKSIVLSISSPGGSVDGTEHLANAVANSKKPVVVHADQMCSAAMWVGSQSKEIFINGKTSMVGSIGTMAVIRNSREFQEKNGVKEVIMFASRSIHKNRAALEAMDGKPGAYQNEFLNPINDVFEGAVQKGRAGKVDYDKEDVGTGKVYMGLKAIRVGLADKIGSLQTAVRRSLQLSQNSNISNTMAFENIQRVTQSTGFEVIEGGFLATEQQLNNLENSIIQSDARISELEQAASQFALTTEAGTQAAADAAATIAGQTSQIATLQARIAELEKLPASELQATVKTGDDKVTGEAEPFVSEETKMANKLRAEAGLPLIK